MNLTVKNLQIVCLIYHSNTRTDGERHMAWSHTKTRLSDKDTISEDRQGCRSRTNGGKSRNENGNRIKKSRQKGMNT